MIKELEEICKDENIITISYDRSCSMAKILVNGYCVMSGNFWDFHPDCHGDWYRTLAEGFGNYSRPGSMAAVLQTAIVAAGRKCEIVENTYIYER